jgi:hypothetical protein
LKQQISRYNPEMWRIFQQMLDIATRKVDSYFNDVAVVDAACMATHDPANRFYWMIDKWGSHWGAANLAGFERMRASIKVFGYRDTLEYYIYDPRTGLVGSTKELMSDAITEDAMRFATSAKRQSTPPPLPIMPNRLIKTVMDIRAKDAALNRESHGGRYYFEEMMLAWTAPKKLYATVRSASWGPRMWPADNHLYFLLAAKDAFKHFGPDHEERWLPETYIYRKGRLEQVTMPEMQADIAVEIARRQPRSAPKPARQVKPLPALPVLPALPPILPPAALPVMQPTLFS